MVHIGNIRYLANITDDLIAKRVFYTCSISGKPFDVIIISFNAVIQFKNQLLWQLKKTIL